MGWDPTPLLLLLLSLPPEVHAFGVFAGGPSATPDYANASAAMMQSVRWAYRRPFIRWALAPDFCSSLQPLLAEYKFGFHWPYGDGPGAFWQNFTTCTRIHGIIADAFATWSASNPALHFVDVTGRCDSERLWKPLADPRACAESDFCLDLENQTQPNPFFVDWKIKSTPLEKTVPAVPGWWCSQRTCFECDRADVMVGGLTQKNRRLGDVHAKARVQRISLSDQPPLGTTGGAVAGKTLERAWLEFNVDDGVKNAEPPDNNGLGNDTFPNCWRLDNDVCDYVITSWGRDDMTSLSETILIWCGARGRARSPRASCPDPSCPPCSAQRAPLTHRCVRRPAGSGCSSRYSCAHACAASSL